MNLNKYTKKINKKLLYFLIIVVIFYLLYVLFTNFFFRKPLIKNKEDKNFDKIPQYLSHKSSCFSCEKQFLNECGDACAWKGNPTKSFDSEIELVNRRNLTRDGYGAKTIKYY